MKKIIQSKVVRVTSIVISVMLIIAIAYPVLKVVVPDIINIVKNNDIEQLEKYIDAFGVFGIIFAVVIQVLQVISIIIPAPLIWVAVGASFGIFQGMVLCCAGMVIGNGLVFAFARKFKWAGSSKKENKQSKNLLSKIKNPDVALFFMYMLPGVPNGIVPYIYANMDISLTKFMCIIGVASVPSILMSTCIGQLLLSGKYILALITAVGLAFAVCVLMLKRELIIGWIDNLISKHRELKTK